MTDPDSDTTRRRAHRTALVLFVVSAVLRLALAGAVAASGAPRLFDEGDYLRRGQAFARILERGLHLAPVAPEDWSTLYDGGTWPPFHPLVLGGVLFATGGGLAAARLAMAVLSALTTPLVYRLGARLATHRAGLAAACLHLALPGFVAFSHYLWSETTYVLLLVAALIVADGLPGAAPGRARTVRALGFGALLGALALTRAAALPTVVAAPLWVAWTLRGGPRALRSALFVALAALVVVAPWELSILRQEGRFAPLVTSGGENLLLGNNRWIPPGPGSSWGDVESQSIALAVAKKRAAADEIPVDVAARRLALETIRADPGGAARRVAERARMLGSADAFLLRYLLRVAYPPLPSVAVAALAAFSAAAQLVLVFLALVGFLARPALRRRGLLLGALALGALPPLATVSVSRMSLPLLALALPAAGYGWVRLRESASGARLALAGAFSLPFAYALVATLPFVLRDQALPSSRYAGLLRRVASVYGEGIGTSDVVGLRIPDAETAGEIELRLSEGFRFLSIDGDRRAALRPDGQRRTARIWRPAGGRPVLVFEAFARHAPGPLEIAVAAPSLGVSGVVRPVEDARWRTWTPTEIPGFDVIWMGGGGKVPSE